MDGHPALQQREGGFYGAIQANRAYIALKNMDCSDRIGIPFIAALHTVGVCLHFAVVFEEKSVDRLRQKPDDCNRRFFYKRTKPAYRPRL